MVSGSINQKKGVSKRMKFLLLKLMMCSLIFESICMVTNDDIQLALDGANEGCAESMFWLGEHHFRKGAFSTGIEWFMCYAIRAKQDFELLTEESKIGKWPILSGRVTEVIKKYPRAENYLFICPQEMAQEEIKFAHVIKRKTEKKHLPAPYWILGHFDHKNAPKFIDGRYWHLKRTEIVNAFLRLPSCPMPVAEEITEVEM